MSISVIQQYAVAAHVEDASGVLIPAGTAEFPNDPGLAAALQAKADASTGITGSSLSKFFAANPTIYAAGQYTGNTIFYNATYFSGLGSGTAMYTMFHESLDLAGFSDQQLESAFGIPASVVAARGSESITDTLEQHCGH